MEQAGKVIGTFAQVGFPDFGIADVTAKIDTGAYRGAIHCTKIRLEEKDGKRVLYFSPFDNHQSEVQADNFRMGKFTSSNGVSEDRYLVSTVISIDDQNYPITLSLANRSEMKWPVLIGRKFLRQNNFLVDASKFKP